MARGNDAAAASADFTTQYGDAPNAEELIAQHRAAQDPRLLRASLSNIDQGATNAVDLSSLEVGENESIVAAAVRGPYVVAVVEDARGNYIKRLMDLPGDAKEKSSANEPVSGPKVAAPEPEPSVAEAAEADAKAAEEAAAKAESEAEAAATEQAKASGSGPDAAAAAEAAASGEAPKASSRSSK
jgi:hypothetical protein